MKYSSLGITNEEMNRMQVVKSSVQRMNVVEAEFQIRHERYEQVHEVF